MLGKAIRQTMLGQSKRYTAACRAGKGRLKGYILDASAVKINCKSFCEVAYTNFGQTFLLL